MDKLDKKILSILTKNARTPFKDVADACGVSRAAIHIRVKKLIDDGIITGSSFNVNPRDLGYTTCAYVGVKFEGGTLFEDAAKVLKQIVEIVECHYTTGNYTLFLKLYAHDNNHLRDILNSIQGLPGLISTETFISLAACFERGVPIQ